MDQKNPPNTSKSGNGLSVMQFSAFRSWKKPNSPGDFKAIQPTPENIYPARRFSWTWFSLELLHSQTTERKKEKKKLKSQSHTPKTKKNPPSKQPGVWAIYWGFFLSINTLIKKNPKSPQKHWNLRGSHVFEVGCYCISFPFYSCLSQKVINVK